jgi:hypothetical protein
LLGRVVGAGRFGRSRIKPTRQIAKGGDQRKARSPLRSRLRRSEDSFRSDEILRRVGDVDNLQSPACQQRVEGKCSVERPIPQANPTAQDSAHGERRCEAIGVLLHQSSGDHATKRVAPGDGMSRSSDKILKSVERRDLIRNRLVNCPTRGRVTLEARGRDTELTTVIL